MENTRSALRFVAACAVVALAACSGGGGGSSPLPRPVATATGGTVVSPTPSPTPTPALTTTSGFVYDLPSDGTASDPGWSVLGPTTEAVPGSPIAGADVYLGATLVLGPTAPSTVPAGIAHAITAGDGSFSIAIAPGTYALTIFAKAPHVTVIHRDLTVAAGNAPGTYMMAIPSTLESAWLAQQTADRAAYGSPALVVDEAALESARYWANFMAANTYFGHCIPESACTPGDTTPAPANYGPQDVDPQHRFAYFHGFSSGGEGENIAAGFATWEAVDSAFMSEVANCPGAKATGCPFSDATGHFLNIIDARYSWTGVSMVTATSGAPYYDEEFTVLSSTLPGAAHARALHPDVRGLKP